MNSTEASKTLTATVAEIVALTGKSVEQVTDELNAKIAREAEAKAWAERWLA